MGDITLAVGRVLGHISDEVTSGLFLDPEGHIFVAAYRIFNTQVWLAEGKKYFVNYIIYTLTYFINICESQTKWLIMSRI